MVSSNSLLGCKVAHNHKTAPTAFSNGPTILECQVDMVVDTIAKLEKENAKTIEAEQGAQNEWCDLVAKMADQTLFPLTSSWWTGGNIPGKKPQMLTYVAGIDTYEATCREKLQAFQGFKVVTAWAVFFSHIIAI